MCGLRSAAAWPGGSRPNPQGSPSTLVAASPPYNLGQARPLSVLQSARLQNGETEPAPLRPRGKEMSGCSCNFGTVSGTRWGLWKH